MATEDVTMAQALSSHYYESFLIRLRNSSDWLSQGHDKPHPCFTERS